MNQRLRDITAEDMQVWVDRIIDLYEKEQEDEVIHISTWSFTVREVY